MHRKCAKFFSSSNIQFENVEGFSMAGEQLKKKEDDDDGKWG